MSKSFIVADLDGKRRHFSKVDNAIKFAISQAKSAWNKTGWTVRVKDTDIRIIVGEDASFVVCDNGHRVGVGNYRLFASMTPAAWDLISIYHNA